MTETTITPQEAFKSKAKFAELMSESTPPEIEKVLSEYIKSDGKVIIEVAELTQNFETLFNVLGDPTIINMPKTPYLVWTVTSEKESIMNVLKTINKHSTKDFGIFVFKALLNENKIDFECLLKPKIPTKSVRNENTPAKCLQKEYWEKYFEICDELELTDFQVAPAPRHYQYISMGKAGVQIMQTVNTKDHYVATEIMINNRQEIYDKLFESKTEIEKELGELDWQPLEGKKSSRIRKTFEIDITIQENSETAVKEHLKMAGQFKTVFTKYL